MVGEYNSYDYFFDLIALSLLAVPVFYALSSARARRVWLGLTGLYLVFFIAPRLALFYLIFWTVLFGLQRLTALLEKKGGRPEAFGALVILALTPMLAWKMGGSDFIYQFNMSLNHLLEIAALPVWEIDSARDFITPIGISYATLRGVDLLVNTWLGKTPALAVDQVMFFGFFPPVQVTGPIIQYDEVATQMQKADPQEIYEGLLRIMTGLVKVLLLANTLSFTTDIFTHTGDYKVWQLWLLLAGYSWYFYLNFAGYSDLAIGLARVYGFKIKENFNFPFARPNIAEFWNSWHMSLSHFAQRNIFVPMGGYRAGTVYLALFCTMMAIALWHAFSLPMVIFGCYHFAGLALHRRFPARIKNRYCAITVTYLFVLLCFPLLGHDMETVTRFYKALVGLS